jgi:hypothetical protein
VGSSSHFIMSKNKELVEVNSTTSLHVKRGTKKMEIIGTSSINMYGRESSVREQGKSSIRKLSVCPERVDENTS